MKKISALVAVLFALAMFLAPTNTALAALPSCKSGFYQNSAGRCVHSPMQSQSVPSGATAICRDGSYSFSQSHRGTCSYHGGVSRWL